MSVKKEPVDTLLALGVEAAREGRRKEARDYLAAVLDLEPTNIPALLWQAWLARNPTDSLGYLVRVMEVDPRNRQGRAGIRWARKRQSDCAVAAADTQDPPPPPPPSPPPQKPNSRSSRLDTVNSEGIQGRVRKAVRAQKARRLLGPFSIFVLILSSVITTFVLVGVFFPSAAVTPGEELAARLSALVPKPSPTLQYVFTVMPSPTFPPKPTATYAPMPTSTALPAPPLAPAGTPMVAGKVLPYSPQSPQEKWIEVDLKAQRLTAYEGTNLLLDVPVSTGMANTPTVQGQFHIYQKLTSTAMVGPGYNLPNVPYTMYFYKSYGLHGTYWHNNFGRPMSHGCVNLKTEDARWLFDWAEPTMPLGQVSLLATKDNPGTLVVVHN